MAEKEYINLYECRDDFYATVLDILSEDSANDRANQIIDAFDYLPTADVAEVVRCKDCKHYDKKYHQCKLHSEEPDQYYTGFIFCMQEDDFCSYGERKE